MQSFGQHLTFLTALAQIWKTAALSPHVRRQIDQGGPVAERCLEALEMWSSQAATNRQGLLELLAEVNSYAISKAGADTDAMSRYDRQRVLKESLLERIISTAVETSDARRMLLAALHSSGRPVAMRSMPYRRFPMMIVCRLRSSGFYLRAIMVKSNGICLG